MKIKNYIIGEFKDTGVNIIDLEAVTKDWNHLWSVSKYWDDYRLIKAYRKDSRERCKFKSGISKEQAEALINTLGLDEEKSTLFRNASTFRGYR